MTEQPPSRRGSLPPSRIGINIRDVIPTDCIARSYGFIGETAVAHSEVVPGVVEVELAASRSRTCRVDAGNSASRNSGRVSGGRARFTGPNNLSTWTLRLDRPA